MFEYQGVTLSWLGHDGFRIQQTHGDKMTTIYIDPFKLSDNASASAKQHSATLLLITHEHFDHLSPDDIVQVTDARTHIISPLQCAGTLRQFGNVSTMRPGTSEQFGDVTVRAMPAYNTNKYRDPATKMVFHPRTDEKLGYLITFSPATAGMQPVTIYHAGDTDDIPEMEALSEQQVDIALLPVSGTYVMTAEEAANATKRIKPKVAIPMHYGEIVGTASDAEKFKELLSETEIKVEILEKE